MTAAAAPRPSKGQGRRRATVFDLAGLGDLTWGGTGRARSPWRTSPANTFCYVNSDADAAPEFEICIVDGGVTASAYTRADFLFL